MKNDKILNQETFSSKCTGNILHNYAIQGTFFAAEDIQNKGHFVFDTVFIRAIIWRTRYGEPDDGPDKDSIENIQPFILFIGNLHTKNHFFADTEQISGLNSIYFHAKTILSGDYFLAYFGL